MIIRKKSNDGVKTLETVFLYCEMLLVSDNLQSKTMFQMVLICRLLITTLQPIQSQG